MEPADAMKGIKGLGARLEGAVIQGQYLIERLVQKGGMAWLYKARHKILQEPMAIKILFPQWSDDPLVRVRFIDEAKIQFKLKHPNIVQVTDVIEDDGIIGIVQEWVEGEDLNQYIQRYDGPMPIDEIWEIVEPLLDALGFAHEMGVVHRDIKPANVLLGRAGDRHIAKLADFGIAKILDELGERTTTGTTLGTMKYIAPEQIRDSKTVDHRADIYGFGVMLYLMATGVYPFTGNLESIMFKQLYEAPPRPRGLNANITPEFEEVILQCLTKHPEDRFPDCNEVLETMRPIMPSRKKRTNRNQALFTGVSHTTTPQTSKESTTSSPSFPKSMEVPRPPKSQPNLRNAPAHTDTSSPHIESSIEHLKRPSQNAGSQSQYPSPYHPPHANSRNSFAPQAPNSFAPQAPNPFAPQAPNPFAPQAPSSFAPQAPGSFAPQAPYTYGSQVGSPSPFANPNQEQWGEFMLDVEDDYYDDDEAPTERPQPSPYATGALVEVKLGHSNSGSESSPDAKSFVQNRESEEPSTMLEEAPSLALLQKIGQEIAGEKSPTPEKEAGSAVVSAVSIATKSIVSSVSFVSPVSTDSLPESLPDSVVSSLPEPPSFIGAETPLDPEEFASPSSASLSALRLKRTGSFKLHLGDYTPPKIDDEAIEEDEEEFVQNDQASSFQNLIQVQETISSENYEQFVKRRKKINPLFIYPLIGVMLGAFVLGVSWLILRFMQ